MAKEKLLFDKTELVCGILMGNSATVVNVKNSDILCIKFIPTEEKGFYIIDPMWDADYCDSLLLSLSETITPTSEIEEDTNFIIEEN